MNNLEVTNRTWDRFYNTADITLNGKPLLCPNISPLLKSSRPNEVDLLYSTKTRYNFEHVESFVVRLFDAPRIYFPKIDAHSSTLDAFAERDPFQNFLQGVVSFPDVAMEYLFYDRNRDKLRNFAALHAELAPLAEFLDTLELNKNNLRDSPRAFVNLNKRLHDIFWRGLFQRGEARRREAMIGRILDYERKYFDYDNPPTNFVNSREQFEYARRINETSQAIAYSNDRECASSFTLHASVLLDDEIMGSLFDYMERDEARLTILKFKELDLRAKVDYTMRANFKQLLAKISEIKQDDTERTRAFMLLEAGNQYAVCLPVFEIISRSFSMIDGDIQFGRNSGRGNFWDNTKLYPRKAKEMDIVFANDPDSFRATNEVAANIEDLPGMKTSTYNKVRRQYFICDMNKRAVEVKRHVEDGTSEIYLTQLLRNSELSPLKDLLLQ